MANTKSISDVFEDLFEAPLRAVTKAEAKYLKIWAEWLNIQLKLIGESTRSPEQITSLMSRAPTVTLDGSIDVGITMRIASVKKSEGGGSIGLQVGPVHASGAFGFSKTSTQESIFQASARFALSNNNADLSQFLSSQGLTPTSVEDLTKASELIKSGLEKIEKPS